MQKKGKTQAEPSSVYSGFSVTKRKAKGKAVSIFRVKKLGERTCLWTEDEAKIPELVVRLSSPKAEPESSSSSASCSSSSATGASEGVPSEAAPSESSLVASDVTEQVPV